MNKITISYDEFDKICARIDKMAPAGEYCPTVTDLKIVKTDMMRFLPFLIWIEETGYETEENRMDRAIIHKMLKEYVEYTDP